MADLNHKTTGDPGRTKSGTKEAILAAAFAEFSDQGLAGARVDRIANLAGVNKAMLYYHFASKENLYHEAIRHHVAAATDQLSEQFDDSVPIEEVLQRIAVQYARIFTSNPKFIRILLWELANPDSEMIRRMAELLVQSNLPIRLRQRMNQEIKAGRWRDLDVKQLLVTFITLNVGYFLLRPLVHRVLTVEDQDSFARERAAAIVEIFLNGVRK
jgi:TetR/AcrR family transcriptional regulator